MSERERAKAGGIPPRPWLSVREAARDYVGCDDALVRAAIRSGALRAYERPSSAARASGRRYYMVHVDDLDAWVRSWPPAPASPLALSRGGAA